MTDPIEIKVKKWDGSGGYKFTELNQQIIHLNKWLFYDYEPLLGGGPTFMQRLDSWLENSRVDEEQKLMFELIPHLFYVGQHELNVLYREAYHSIFAKWLIDQLKVSLNETDVQTKLNDEIGHTWFCPFTDSLRINQFYHINNIPGQHDHRPDWRSLRTFGDTSLIKKYIIDNDIRRIVLLEDFIGNGGQISKAAEFVAENFDLPILIIPLIICPAGVEQSAKFTALYPNFQISPVLSIDKNYFVHKVIGDITVDFFKKIHVLATSSYKQVANSTINDDNIDPYGPFGWRNTGGLIIMHTNTPNNTLPFIHNKSETWNPLFKRHKRI